MLADLLTSKVGRDGIASFHRHDSLLDHQQDQELTEEDREAAWKEYNAEKEVCATHNGFLIFENLISMASSIFH